MQMATLCAIAVDSQFDFHLIIYHSSQSAIQKHPITITGRVLESSCKADNENRPNGNQSRQIKQLYPQSPTTIHN